MQSPVAMPSRLDIHVASSPEAFHWSAQHICLAGVRVCCRRVLGSIPLASSAHVEAAVIQGQYQCSHYHYFLQRCGTPLLYSLVFPRRLIDDVDKVLFLVGVLSETPDVHVPKAAEIIEGTSRSPQRRYPKGV
jgi:hypothetical protein